MEQIIFFILEEDTKICWIEKIKISDIIDFVTASDSELSKLSDDDNDNKIEVPQNVLGSTAEVSSDEENEDENDVPLGTL